MALVAVVVSWQPTNFDLVFRAPKSCAQSHALSRDQPPDRSRDTSHDEDTLQRSHDMTSYVTRCYIIVWKVLEGDGMMTQSFY